MAILKTIQQTLDVGQPGATWGALLFMECAGQQGQRMHMGGALSNCVIKLCWAQEEAGEPNPFFPGHEGGDGKTALKHE